MSGRFVSLGVAVALMIGLIVVVGALVSACYSVPEPDCGFICGPSRACPDDYTCAFDQRCHRNGTPASLVCGTDLTDAAVPPDAPSQTPPDAPDATSDVGPLHDAAVD